MNTIRKYIQQYRQFIIYSIIGVMGATFDFTSFSLLVYFHILPYLVANIVSTSIGITNNFLLNAFLNFKTRDKLVRRFLSFYSIGLVGLGISSILLWLLVHFFHTNELVAKFCTIVVVVIVQYSLNKRISFKQHPKEELSTKQL